MPPRGMNSTSSMRPTSEPSNGFERWSEEDYHFFASEARINTFLHRAIVIGYYTGQRISDILKMRWSDDRGAWLLVRQQKTGTVLHIPIHPTLRDLFDSWRCFDGAGEDGQPSDFNIVRNPARGWSRAVREEWSIDAFSAGWNRAKKECNKPYLKFHGLRKNCASMLAEAGATPHEIAAIGGWKSLRHVELYTAQVTQATLAKSAMDKLVASGR